MGKSARLRQNPSASPLSASTRAAASVAMRRSRMKRPSAAAGQSCRASSVVLTLLVALGLGIFTVFLFTLRPGHAPLRKASQKPTLSRDEGMDREIELSDHHRPLELNDTVGVYGYEIVREFHHDPNAFTQGLAYAGNGTLYESTGLYSKSSVREVDLRTGEVRRKHQMKPRDFGEGLTIWKDRLLQVVWKEKKVLIYDRETLIPKGEVSHRMQDGWGLTTGNNLIIGSDGTSKLYFMDPDTLEEVRVVTVTDGDREVGWLNELEYVNDEIWANIWQGGCIARISPRNGKVTGWILLHGLRNRLLAAGNEGLDVLNGIAWDSEKDKIYVTGKMWPKLYEIRLLDRTHNANGSLQAVQRLCNIGRQGFQ
ncbi:unnamed protein product [Calypogeia fissa]